MPRVKRGTKRRAKRKKILDRASGYFLTKSKLYRSAKEAVERGLKFAYAGRRQKKRQYRSLWIVRIGAAAKLNGMSYNQFIHGLKKSGVELDRKILADLAVNDAAAFKSLAEQARGALGGGAEFSSQLSNVRYQLVYGPRRDNRPPLSRAIRDDKGSQKGIHRSKNKKHFARGAR